MKTLWEKEDILETSIFKFEDGPSDLGKKILQKILKNYPYTHKAF